MLFLTVIIAVFCFCVDRLIASSLISNSSTNIDADMFPQMSLSDKTNVAITVRAVMDSCRSLLPRFVDIASTLDDGVSVIIGTYNRYLSLDAIIKVLKKQKFVNHLEIIVSDAGSWPPAFNMVPDKSVDVVIYRRYDGKYHRVRSFNEGARAAKHDILIFLDDDVIPASEYWAFAALSAFRKSNATSIVRMPMYLSPDLQLKYDLSNAVAAQAHLAKQRKAAFQIHNWTTVNMAVRRQVWENIGGLNWTYDGKYGYEDFEFHDRVKRNNTIHYADADMLGCAVHIGTFYKKRFPRLNHTQYNTG